LAFALLVKVTSGSEFGRNGWERGWGVAAFS